MSLNRVLLSAALLAAACLSVARAAGGPLSLVDPFVGTSGTKIGGPIDTFPGADAPFGMVQFSPDTPSQPAGGGYNYTDTAITGFSLDHLSGPGCSVFGDIAVLPVVGNVSNPAQVKQPFSHVGEIASPGYYAVTLGAAPGIRAELTAGERSGIARFTYPTAQDEGVLINPASDQAGVDDAFVRILSPTDVEGFATSGSFCGMPDVYTVYFAIHFDRPMIGSGVWNGSLQSALNSARGPQVGASLRFGSDSRVVTMHAALSWVSQNGAWTNLRASDSPSFDAQRAQTQALWRTYLSRVRVTGGTPAEQRTFYTALYHTLLHPNLYSDADGRYRGFDNAVHRVRAGHQEYATFSGWDIYRTQLPLIALLAPHRTSDMMQSLVDAAKQGGWLPKWPLVNGYTAVMGGDPAAPILGAAYAFGARGFDTRAALLALVKNADDTTSPPGQGWYRPRPGLGEYERLGYVVNTHTTNVAPVPNGASLTLEYSLDDFSIAQFAKAIGRLALYREYMGRSQNWRNLFDTRTGLITPRDGSGAFMQTPITPNGQSGFQEGNAAQYTWMVPEDLATLIYGMGGRQAAIERLDTYFTQLNAGQDKPYAWLGNEPSLGDPWVYLSAGAPSKAQSVIRAALTTLYGDTPDGLPGNDDLGTMSAWYVWCALGLYPQYPALPILDLGTPLFTSARIAVPGGVQIAIDAPKAGAQMPYLQSVSVDGRARTKTWVHLQRRGVMRIRDALSATPTSWGSARRDAPPSFPVTLAQFPPTTNAQFAGSNHEIDVAPGGDVAVQVGLRDPGSPNPPLVTWHMRSPEGITAMPDSGTLAADGVLHAQLHVDASLAADYYPITIDARTSAGAILEPWTIDLKAAPPGAQIPLAYVPNFADNTLTAFDPQTGAIVRNIAVGTNPGDVARTPDGKRLLVANQGSNSVSVVDAENGTVIATIATGKVPASLRIAPDGSAAWVTDYGDNAVQRIDLRTLLAGPPIAVGRAPQQLAFTPDGSMLYVVDQSDNAVTPIDIASGRALAPIPVGERPFGIVISPGGNRAYVSDTGENAVTPIDLRTGTAQAVIAVGVQPQGMALDGSTLYVANSGTDTISVVDTNRRIQTGTIRAGLNPQSVALSADGRTIFAVVMGDNACVKIPIAHPAKRTVIPMGSVPIALSLP